MDFVSANGLRLTRTSEQAEEIAALKALVGGAVGLHGVVGNLNRQGRRSMGWLGRAVREAYTWDDWDRRTQEWYPQGITTSADAYDGAGSGEAVSQRDVLAMTWYAREVNGQSPGSRVTFYDLATQRYRHVLLVHVRLGEDGKLTLEPVRIHAGGVVWAGEYLHIAATTRGLITCRLDDIVRVPLAKQSTRTDELLADEDQVAAYGYSHLLPVRFTHQARTDEGHPALRYSFLSLDRRGEIPHLVCGEYGRGDQTTRLARIPLSPGTLLPDVDPADPARSILLSDVGVKGMQGVATAGETYFVTSSHGSWIPGSVYVGRPGAFRARRLAVPPGPEDVSYSPLTDRLWTLTEHPRRRWIVGLDREWLARK